MYKGKRRRPMELKWTIVGGSAIMVTVLSVLAISTPSKAATAEELLEQTGLICNMTNKANGGFVLDCDPPQPTPSPTTSSSPEPSPTPTMSPTPSPTPTTPSPTPTTPSPTGPLTNCFQVPSRCGFPDLTNTGVVPGTVLTNSGGLVITEVGAVIEHLNINGCVEIKAANVTIRNSKINCNNGWGVRNLQGDHAGTGVVIEDVEVDCIGGLGTGLVGYGFVARRVNVHNCENGASVDGQVTIEDSYIWSFRVVNGGHADGIQMDQVSNITIQHNTIAQLADGGTSAIISNARSNILFQNNILAGTGYTLRCPQSFTPTNYRTLNNRFTRHYDYGPMIGRCGAAGNVWDDTGQLM